MNLNNVFIGYTKSDGTEHLLQKRVSYYGNKTYFTDYIDLENEDEFYSDYQIDTNNLSLFEDCLGVQNNIFGMISKRKVKKIYKADREKMIDVRKLFYGNIITRFRLSPSSRFLFEKCDKENELFLLEDGQAMDMRNNNYYPLKEDTLIGMGVVRVRDVQDFQIDMDMQPKRKILEMDHRKEL